MASGGSGHRAGAFDIRSVIAALFGIYGVVLIIVGVVEPTAEITKSAGVNINLWGGVGMLVFAIVMVGWARLRPIVVPDNIEDGE